MFYNSDLYTNFTQAVNLSRGIVILSIFVKVRSFFYHLICYGLWLWCCYNATFNDISIISVLLLEETEVTRKTTDLWQVTDKLNNNVVPNTPRHDRDSNFQLWW